MSMEQVSVPPGRAGTQVRRDRVPARGRGSRAAARPAARDAGWSERTRPDAGPASTKARLALAAPVMLAIALLLAAVLNASGVGPWAGNPPASRLAASPVPQTIDPRLILVPRTVKQAATAGGVRMELTEGPLLPGANRFELRLAEHGRPLTGARVLLVARMLGMAMRPVTLPMREVRSGRYAATGPLSMFGQWQVAMRIDRPGTASLRHEFTAGVDLPRGLLTAPATRGAPRQ